MTTFFSNRGDAGRQLGELLQQRVSDGNVIVLGLARGGLPVAAEVARALGAPLDALIVRKLGMPFNPEFAFGALASGGHIYIDDSLVSKFAMPQEQIDEIVAGETAELRRREQVYRAGRNPLDLASKTAIVVDDGIATGATMRAALMYVRSLRPVRVVLAVPVAPDDSAAVFADLCDEFVCVRPVAELGSVGQFYAEFGQVSDAEVVAILQGH